MESTEDWWKGGFEHQAGWKKPKAAKVKKGGRKQGGKKIVPYQIDLEQGGGLVFGIRNEKEKNRHFGGVGGMGKEKKKRKKKIFHSGGRQE